MKRTETEWVQEALENAAGKLKRVSQRSADKIPYTTVDGVHDDHSGEGIGWWTNGFWGGLMWQMYTLTGEAPYRSIAERTEEKLDAKFLCYDRLDHDNGFVWLPTAVANYKVTGSLPAKNRGLLAAGQLAGRYNCAGKFIRAWNNHEHDDHDRTGWTIIDCMMNLPLLYWASKETGDPRFCQIAQNHAHTTRRHFVREDGSVKHIVSFDPVSGEMLRNYRGQGYREDSAWTRGQAWGLYGFALSYLHTKVPAFLETAERIADYFIANIPSSGWIPVDFCQPESVHLEDSTASAIAVCGLLELAKLQTGPRQAHYTQQALRLLKALSAHRVNLNLNEDNLLTNCTAAYHDKTHEFSIIYGDYYYLEALMKFSGNALPIWQ